jgi:predicted ribosomally synthesized peptide with SipW-like signal peptide
MKKILLSLSAIVFVAAAAAGATGAFFNDTETSTGNTFTAGAIDLKVDDTQHYNHMVCTLVEQSYVWVAEVGFVPGPGHTPTPGSACNGTWTLTDLANGVQKFWNFTDVKPGDEGENTVSLHIDSNPAWACVDLNLTKNDDVDCTDPENEAEGEP